MEILNFLNLLETSKYLKMMYRKSPLWCTRRRRSKKDSFKKKKPRRERGNKFPNCVKKHLYISYKPSVRKE